MTLQGKISIVIPCFNCGPMLLETLASIERARTDFLAEVIIVNDGSTDPETREVLEQLDITKYIVVHQINRGASAARNAGIEVARGEFILPVDSDDYIRRAYLDKGATILIAKPDVGVVYGDLEFFGEIKGRYLQQFEWSSIARRNCLAVCALYRRRVWESVGGYDEKMRPGYEDWDFWMRVGLQGWKFVHVGEIGFDYRIRTGSHNSDAVRNHREIVEYIFGKPEYEVLRSLRDQAVQFEELSRKFRSWDYRVGNVIVAPIRKITRIPAGIRRRLRERAAAREPK